MYNYLNDNNILVGDQYGFREKLSTETAIYTLLNNVLSPFVRRDLVGGLFFDLQKAFDCINHEILLPKMKFYEICGIANQMLHSDLHMQYVKSVRDEYSRKHRESLNIHPNPVVKSLLLHNQQPRWLKRRWTFDDISWGVVSGHAPSQSGNNNQLISL